MPEPVTAKQCDIALIGSWSWQANRDGLEWFLHQVCPHLPSNIEIQIAGPDGDDLLKDIASVNYVGFVPNAQVFMAGAQVVAIPSVHGSGIQIKTLEAIASGSAIVATSVAMRGIDRPPPTVHVADTPQVFANRLREQVENPQSAPTVAQQWYRDRGQQLRATVQANLIQLINVNATDARWQV